MKWHIRSSFLLLFLVGVLGCGKADNSSQQSSTTDDDAAKVASSDDSQQADGKSPEGVVESDTAKPDTAKPDSATPGKTKPAPQSTSPATPARVANAQPGDFVYMIDDFAGALILRPRQMTETEIGKQIPVDEFLAGMGPGGPPFRAADVEQVTMLGVMPETPGSDPVGVVVVNFINAATLAKVRANELAPFADMEEAEHAGRTYLRFPESEIFEEPAPDEVKEIEALPPDDFGDAPRATPLPPEEGDDGPNLDATPECGPNDEAADDVDVEVGDGEAPIDGAGDAAEEPGDLGPDEVIVSEDEVIVHGSGPAFYFPDDRTMVISEEELLKKLLEAKKPSGPLVELLAGVEGDHDIVAVGVMGPVNEVLEGINPAELPPQLGMVLGLRTFVKSAVFTADLDGPQLAQLTLNSPDGDSAAQMHAVLDGLLQWGKNMFQQNRKTIVANIEKELPASTMKLMDEFVAAAAVGLDKENAQVTFTIDAPPSWNELPAIVKAVMAKQQEQAAAFRHQLNAQSIAFGFFNYESTYGEYPRAAAPENEGGPAVSWRVRILPFLGEEQLYEQYNLDEPWDSEQNMKLLAKMPEIFGDDPAGKTRYVVFTGDGTFFGQDGKLGFDQIKDGASQTILFVEAGADVAVPWTKPVDLKFNPEKPLAALGNVAGSGFVAAMMDGSVRNVPGDVAAEKLKAAITHAGGEEVELFDAESDFPDGDFPGNPDSFEPDDGAINPEPDAATNREPDIESDEP